MTYKRYELFHTSFTPHSETFTQSFRPQIIVFDKSVNTSCVGITEKVVQKSCCRFIRQSLAFEMFVEMPTNAISVSIFAQSENITDNKIVLSQTYGIAQHILGRMENISQCRFFRIQTVTNKAIDAWMRKVFQQTCGILFLKVPDDKMFCFNDHISQILDAKILRTQYADNRNTIETEKTASRTTKIASEISAIANPSICRIVLSGQRLPETAAFSEVPRGIKTWYLPLYFFSG